MTFGIVRAPIALAVGALLLAGCKTDLYTKVSEKEANEMLAILFRKGIDAQSSLSKDGTVSLQVEKDSVSEAIEVLKASGYPRQTYATMGEVFKGNGLIVSPTEERARFIYALSEELSRTISDLDGVLSARVHVVLPKNDLLHQEHTPSSASVFIRHDSKSAINRYLPQIKMLVANSVEGLSYDKVAVIFIPVELQDYVGGSSPPVRRPPMVLGVIPPSAITPVIIGLALFAFAALLFTTFAGPRILRRFRRGVAAPSRPLSADAP